MSKGKHEMPGQLITLEAMQAASTALEIDSLPDLPDTHPGHEPIVLTVLVPNRHEPVAVEMPPKLRALVELLQPAEQDA